MATWQVYFSAVDKNKKNNDEDICYWDKEPVNVYDISFLKKNESWSNDIIQYGSLQSTCIELLMENGRIVEISIRLDLRMLTKSLLINVVDYIIRLNSNIYYQNEIIIPSITNISNLIKKSDAYKYCQNPLTFIDDLYNDEIS